MSYILLFVYFGLLSLLIYRSEFYKTNNLKPVWIWGIFVSKFMAGIVLWAVYAFMYEGRATGDIFKYFDDGNIVFSALRENPIDYIRIVTGIGGDSPHLMKYYDTCYFWIKEHNYGLINDNRIVIRFNAIVRLFSMGNIHIHTLFMSFLSFTGLWAIFKVFEKQTKIHVILLVLIVFYFPSITFWTSGLLKEGLLIFGFGILFYAINKIIEGNAVYASIVIVLLFVIFLLYSKFYVLLAATPGFLFLFFNKYFGKWSMLIKFIVVHLLVFLLVWFSELIIGLSFPEILSLKQQDFVSYINSLKSVGSAIEIAELDGSFYNLLNNIPAALVNVVFRPTIFESKNLLMLMAAFENTLILLLIVFSIVFFRKQKINQPLLWFSFSFCFVLFSLIGLTTPVLGALVRYKTPALPFFGILLIYFIDVNKMKCFFVKIKLLTKLNRQN